MDDVQGAVEPGQSACIVHFFGHCELPGFDRLVECSEPQQSSRPVHHKDEAGVRIHHLIVWAMEGEPVHIRNDHGFAGAVERVGFDQAMVVRVVDQPPAIRQARHRMDVVQVQSRRLPWSAAGPIEEALFIRQRDDVAEEPYMSGGTHWDACPDVVSGRFRLAGPRGSEVRARGWEQQRDAKDEEAHVAVRNGST